MTQSVLPPDKTFRMAVKLVSTDGNVLPFEGFMLVPEGRLVLLEKLATTARTLGVRSQEAAQHPEQGFLVETSVKDLRTLVSELEKVWDIP
jgi:hypothetical protein